MSYKIVDSAERLTAAQITAVERKLGRRIPSAFKKFLTMHNSGWPDPPDFRMRKGNKIELGAIKSFLGIGTREETVNLDYVLSVFSDRMPPHMFPVARDPGGNFIVVSTRRNDNGKVFFWDHEHEADEGSPPTERNLYFIADSFEQFLDSLGKV